MADEEQREIQLRGKHLVSLFMASAFLLVATFLCGVLVGRGVRSQKEAAVTPGSAASTSATTEDPTSPPAPLQPMAKTPAQAPAQAASTPPPVPEEELSYYSRLDGKPATAGPAKPVATPPAPKTAAKTAPPPPPAQNGVAPPAPKPTAAAPPKAAGAPATKPAEAAGGSDPPGAGYVVKIAAYRDKGQSSALAARLVAKGYAAYVVTVAGKGAPLYSVRVGKFKARADAEAAKRRLEKEEQFKPLITR